MTEDPKDPIDKIFETTQRFLDEQRRRSEMGRGPEPKPPPNLSRDVGPDMGFATTPGPVPGTPGYEAQVAYEKEHDPIIRVTPEAEEEIKARNLELDVLEQKKARLLREIQELKLTKERTTQEIAHAREARAQEAQAREAPAPEKAPESRVQDAPEREPSKMRDIGSEGMPRARFGTDYYDSSQRRDELQKALERAGVEAEAIAVRMFLEVSQGQPPHKAVEKRPEAGRGGPEKDGPGESRGLAREPE